MMAAMPMISQPYWPTISIFWATKPSSIAPPRMAGMASEEMAEIKRNRMVSASRTG
ncbi:hypothetical protein D9M69_693930 [compost metagenome]